MKILVTGGAGFIGSHISDAYLAAGHEVMVLDDLSTGKEENVPAGAKFVLGDICTDVAEEAIRTFRPEILNHHAAQMDVRRSVADPAFDARVNLLGMLRLLEAGRQNGLRKVIFASSGGAGYGEHDYFPADEKHPIRPVSPYGVAKMATEMYLHFYRVQYGIDYTALRYANVYGPRQNSHGEAGVVAIFAKRLLQGQLAIINGDGLQTRDFVYVGDIVKANLAALERGSGMGINIGTGIENDINTVFRRLLELSGSSQKEMHVDAAAGEQRRSVLENRMAFDELGWYPEVSLEDGLALSMAFFREKNQKPDQW